MPGDRVTFLHWAVSLAMVALVDESLALAALALLCLVASLKGRP